MNFPMTSLIFPHSLLMILIAFFTGVVGYSAKMEKIEVQAVTNNTEQGVSMSKSFSQLVKNPFLFKCSVLMLVASIVFGAITTFIPLYATQLKDGNSRIYLMLQASTIVIARFTLKRKIPSDDKYHSSFIISSAVCKLLYNWWSNLFLCWSYLNGSSSGTSLSNANNVFDLCLATNESQCVTWFIYCDGWLRCINDYFRL